MSSDLPEPVDRLLRYAGKTMRTARNPNLTAREAIAVGCWIRDALASQTAALTDERLNAAGLDYALADSFTGKGEWMAQDIADAFKAGARAAERFHKIGGAAAQGGEHVE